LNVSKFLTILILILFLGTTACNLPSNQPATQDPYEAAVLTVTAMAGTEQASQPSPTFTFTSTPPTPSSTATSGQPPGTAIIATSTPGGTFFVVDVGANCRTGPGTIYDRIASFAQGTYLTPTGCNTDSTWWYVNSDSTTCWISASTGHTTGSASGLPVVAAPPTPTLTATTTGTATAGPRLSYLIRPIARAIRLRWRYASPIMATV
jgi:hypothetical protein